jgi:hypothetical protein
MFVYTVNCIEDEVKHQHNLGDMVPNLLGFFINIGVQTSYLRTNEYSIQIAKV